ncbi:MAG: WD40 domain-containing protein, partial [Acidiferrobacterales bacterium]
MIRRADKATSFLQTEGPLPDFQRITGTTQKYRINYLDKDGNQVGDGFDVNGSWPKTIYPVRTPRGERRDIVITPVFGGRVQNYEFTLWATAISRDKGVIREATALTASAPGFVTQANIAVGKDELFVISLIQEQASSNEDDTHVKVEAYLSTFDFDLNELTPAKYLFTTGNPATDLKVAPTSKGFVVVWSERSSGSGETHARYFLVNGTELAQSGTIESTNVNGRINTLDRVASYPDGSACIWLYERPYGEPAYTAIYLDRQARPQNRDWICRWRSHLEQKIGDQDFVVELPWTGDFLADSKPGADKPVFNWASNKIEFSLPASGKRMRISPDQRWIAAAWYAGNKFDILDLKKPDDPLTIRVDTKAVFLGDVRITSDDRYCLVSAGGTSVQLFNTESGEHVGDLSVGKSGKLDISANKRVLINASRFLSRYDISERGQSNMTDRLMLENKTIALKLSTDGNRVLRVDDRWNIQLIKFIEHKDLGRWGYQQVHSIKGSEFGKIVGMGWSGDTDQVLVAWADGKIQSVDLKTGKILSTIDTGLSSIETGRASTKAEYMVVAGTKQSSGDSSATLLLVDLRIGKITTLIEKLEKDPQNLTFIPAADGKSFMAVDSHDGVLLPVTGKPIAAWPERGVITSGLSWIVKAIAKPFVGSSGNFLIVLYVLYIMYSFVFAFIAGVINGVARKNTIPGMIIASLSFLVVGAGLAVFMSIYSQSFSQTNNLPVINYSTSGETPLSDYLRLIYEITKTQIMLGLIPFILFFISFSSIA